MWESTQFERGDVIVHTRRPEWGDGVVPDDGGCAGWF